MGKRAKIVAEIEREIARLGDQPGLCLFYAHAHGRRLVAASDCRL